MDPGNQERDPNGDGKGDREREFPSREGKTQRECGLARRPVPGQDIWGRTPGSYGAWRRRECWPSFSPGRHDPSRLEAGMDDGTAGPVEEKGKRKDTNKEKEQELDQTNENPRRS